MKTYTYELEIKEFHLDTFGHVNNATYLQLFEEARWELITQNGYGLKKVKETQQGPVILEAHLKFLKELKLREKVTITTRSLGYEGKIGKIEQKILNSAGQEACILIMVFGLFDLKNRKLIEPTPDWLKAIS